MNLNTKKTSIIVPFFNEEATLKDAVLDLTNSNFTDEIILINDGSTDNSVTISTELIKKYPYVKLINNIDNRGKGHALRCGLEQASFEVIGIFDADLEYSAKDLQIMCDFLHKRKFDLLVGSRFIGDKQRDNIYLRTFFANKFLSWFFSKVYKKKFTDVATCLKVFRKDLLKGITLESNGFEIEIELLAKLLPKLDSFKEFPISYKGRSYFEGKKIKLYDGFKYIFTIIKYK